MLLTRQTLPNKIRRSAGLWQRRRCPGWLALLGLRFLGLKLRGIRPDNLKRGVANGRAEELTLIVGHLQEPARPAPRIAADLAIGQVAYDCQRLLAGGRPVRQFNPFLVRQDAVSEVEMEEIKRHLTLTRGGLVCSILDSGTDKVPNFKITTVSFYKS